MKISYNWLREYIPTDLKSEEIGQLLTDCGLEVESIVKFESVRGGLEGIVVGEVKSREKHPEADRLSLTTVDVGTGTLLNIVCGAANVAAGQKVLVALTGAKLFPLQGDPIEIKKSKIRGAVSEGMICAEDEIGVGTSHDGIMVLPSEVLIGTPAKEYFKLESDLIFEIGLTPNRGDAASHMGVARDLAAVLNLNSELQLYLHIPPIAAEPELSKGSIQVEVQDRNACPRYSGIELKNIKVADSPSWLKSRLMAIGLKPINNIVDITNYVMHETGQPLHAFDSAKIKGKKIFVRRSEHNSVFTGLDGNEYKMSSDDLMICNSENAMCIAGVFGGQNSGVTESTKSVFLESAYFNAGDVRKTSRRHGLKTDASFRYERGADPENTVFALLRAVYLMQEIAGAEMASDIIDHYPEKIEPVKVPFSFEKCDSLIGKHIEHELIIRIFKSLGISVEHEGKDALLVSVPLYKSDVTREQDLIEEVLRIYGYNKIDAPHMLRSSLSFAEKPDKEKLQVLVSDFLSNNGYSEMMGLSLTKEGFASHMGLKEELNVKMLNPLSSDLSVLRQSLLFSGLEAISYNVNRKSSDLKLYEFGKTYQKLADKYLESKKLSIFISGKEQGESWSNATKVADFYTMKKIVSALFDRLGIEISFRENSAAHFSSAITCLWKKRSIAEFGTLSKAILKHADIRQDVLFADINWDLVTEATSAKKNIVYKEVAKFPEVRRDLALLIDKALRFEELEQLAFQTEKNILRSVNLFDIYQGDKLPAGKKSYALRFTLQDESATLTDKQIEKTMEKLIKVFQEKAGAEIRI